MVKLIKQNFFVAVNVTLLGLSLSLLLHDNTWAQTCNPQGIDTSIKKLKIDFESESAIEALQKCGFSAVSQLKDALKNPDQRVRRRAAQVLGEVGSSGTVAVSDLTTTLQDTDLEVRLEAAKALLKIDSNSQAAVLAVIEISKLYDVQVNGGASAAINQEISSLTAKALIKLLTNKNNPDSLRLYALNAISNFILGGFQNNPEAKVALTVLLNVLEDETESDSIRSKAISALSQFGSQDKVVIEAFIRVFKNAKEPLLRQQAAEALRIGAETSETQAAVLALIEVFKDKGEPPPVRNGALNALLNIKPLGTGSEAKAAVNALITVFEDKSDQFRSSAARILGKMGPEAEAAVEPLIKVFEDEKNESLAIRSDAARALGEIGSKAKKAVKPLLEAFKNPNEDETVRFIAVEALGGIGSEAEATVPVLLNNFIELVKNKDPRNRWFKVGEALEKIIVALEEQPESLSMSIGDLDKAIEALKLLKAPEGEGTFQGRSASHIRRSLEAIKAKKQANVVARIIEKIRQNQLILGVSIYVISLLFLWLVILRLRPLLLLRINDSLKPYTDFALPLPLNNSVKLPIRFVLFVGFFHYHPRVLDAWVAEYIDTACNKFQGKDTVKEREFHVAVPVRLDGEEIDELSPENLRSKFTDKRACLLIWGDGGTGKTSLACQVAKWAMAENKTKRLHREHLMLPVLIEQELDNVGDGKKPLIEAISGQLGNLVDKKEPISEELLENLLRQRRILVIVDHFSEMSEVTRNQIRPNLRDFPVNALIVTSRIKESLDDAVDTAIETRRIEGYRLSGFMHSYLEQKGKFNLFDDIEFLNACTQLSALVGERREITVLLAKLYAERMINSKENPAIDNRPPDNIPDLMVSYLEELNKKAEIETRNKYFTVKEDAKVIAWKCLEQNYQPRYAERKAISDALALLGRDNAEAYLEYFEKHLRLLRTAGPAKDQIRFELDPLTEYLAGLHLVEDLYREDEELWRDFLHKLEAISGTREQIKGFLLAVRDCCLAKKEVKVPSFVAYELGKLVGLDVEAIKREQLERRIRRLIFDLYVPEAEDRARAARDLGKIGSEAKAVVPRLIHVLKDENKDVRLAAIRALGKMGSEALAAVPDLLKALDNKDKENWDVRLFAAVALGKIGSGAKDAVSTLIQILENRDEDREVRFVATWALGKIGAEAKDAVPTLVEALKDEDKLIRLGAAWALGAIGLPAKETVPVLIKVFEDRNEDKDVRSRAVWALGRIGSVEEATLVAFIETVENNSEYFDVRWCTAWALGRIHPPAKSAVRPLIKVIGQEYRNVTGRSAIPLERYFNVKVEDTLSALKEAYEAPGREFWKARNALQAAAEDALSRILGEENNQSA
jgi:HEAT repeat protein